MSAYCPSLARLLGLFFLCGVTRLLGETSVLSEDAHSDPRTPATSRGDLQGGRVAGGEFPAGKSARSQDARIEGGTGEEEFNAKVAKARAQFLAGEIELAERVLRELETLAPDHPRVNELLQKIAEERAPGAPEPSFQTTYEELKPRRSPILSTS